jgi:hypothetical protein
MKCSTLMGFAACLTIVSTQASALTVTKQDCREGAQFIENAALSRDNGMSANNFVDRLEEDLVLIKSFPPSVRWFARDDDDEEMLRRSVHRVFDEPGPPREHRRQFLEVCLPVATGT